MLDIVSNFRAELKPGKELMLFWPLSRIMRSSGKIGGKSLPLDVPETKILLTKH
jgi:hypothetical protein